uniref:Uncharacterized protein n=1 Tax=Sphaerodactylus townsendi TaxID=933632 RepID=A0ACB8G7E1_9SAUR
MPALQGSRFPCRGMLGLIILEARGCGPRGVSEEKTPQEPIASSRGQARLPLSEEAARGQCGAQLRPRTGIEGKMAIGSLLRDQSSGRPKEQGTKHSSGTAAQRRTGWEPETSTQMNFARPGRLKEARRTNATPSAAQNKAKAESSPPPPPGRKNVPQQQQLPPSSSSTHKLSQ